MKTYRILAAFFFLIMAALPVSGQFRPAEGLTPYPECGFDYECFQQKENQKKALQSNEIERQEEEIPNKRIQEIKENAERPELNKKGP
jgi:hypothetical protein